MLSGSIESTAALGLDNRLVYATLPSSCTLNKQMKFKPRKVIFQYFMFDSYDCFMLYI